ncbi:permease [Pseudomonas syringae pv. actinidifoliorum]|nr:permease [Pseudomonas syringae pv. actinidifoliorum]
MEKALNLPKGKDILNWKIKTLARSPKEIMITQLGFAAFHVMASSLFIWLGWVMFSGSPSSLVCVILALGGHLAYFIGLLIRQKTIYNYTIKTDCAHLEYYLHYPDFASSFFKGIAIAVILIFFFIAVLTGSLLFLIGPVAMAFIAALKLLNWENPIHHEQSLPWGEYNFVTIDRKRLMIITHRTDVTLGFEARFKHEVLFNKYLNFLHTALPPTAEFTEKAWK